MYFNLEKVGMDFLPKSLKMHTLILKLGLELEDSNYLIVFVCI